MDYEKAYTNAVARAKQAIKDCGHNEGRKRMIEDIFPELADPDRIRQELIQYLKDYPNLPNGRYCREDFFAWLEKQGEQNPAWSDEDEKIMKQIDSLLYCQCTIHSSMYEKLHNWLKSLKPQSRWKPNVEQLTAFAQHLNKRGAFRDDLCMDFEHEAQSFIEMQKFNATQLGV